MREELRSYLDGEIELDALPPELRAEAAAWDAAAGDLRDDAPAAPTWLEGRVMAEIHGEAGERAAAGPAGARQAGSGPGAVATLVDWLVRPRTVRVSPLAAFAVVAALLVAAPLAWRLVNPGPGAGGDEGATAGGLADGSVVYVQFLLDAPAAASVAVAGDFNDWGESYLEDADGDGVWTGRVALRPGVHRYMFVLDGDRWVTDPAAERYSDDGFGNRNAVVAVAAPAT